MEIGLNNRFIVLFRGGRGTQNVSRIPPHRREYKDAIDLYKMGLLLSEKMVDDATSL